MMLTTTLLKTEGVFSKIIVDLITDNAVKTEVERLARRFRTLNNEEHKRISERELHRLIMRDITKQYPSITKQQADEIFQRRLTRVLRPYTGNIGSEKIVASADTRKQQRKLEAQRRKQARKT